MKLIAASLLITISIGTGASAQSDDGSPRLSGNKQLALDAFDTCYGQKLADTTKPIPEQTKKLMRDAWSLVYSAHFSSSELQTVQNFCKTSAGAKFVADHDNLDFWLVATMEKLAKENNSLQDSHGKAQ